MESYLSILWNDKKQIKGTFSSGVFSTKTSESFKKVKF